jgi:hypothetical protein
MRRLVQPDAPEALACFEPKAMTKLQIFRRTSLLRIM